MINNCQVTFMVKHKKIYSASLRLAKKTGFSFLSDITILKITN